MLPNSTIVFFLCLFTTSAFAHDEFILDSRRPTPNNVQLKLKEMPGLARSGNRSYRLQAIGLPDEIKFGIYTRDFAHPFKNVMSGLHVDKNGNVISNDAGNVQRLDEIVFEPGPYPRGAAWELALVSADRSIRAFAKVFPQPIAARDNTCSVILELVSQRGDRFVATGEGFATGEELIAESRYAGRVIRKRLQVSAEGLMPAHILTHGSTGPDRRARYTVRAHSCEITVDYEWGEPALIRRPLIGNSQQTSGFPAHLRYSATERDK
jgi:hypothetical protein